MTVLPLFLSDVAGSEVVLILVVVLIFFGSKSIPGIAKTMGTTMRQIKDATQEVQNEIKKSTGDMRKDFDIQKMVDESVEDVKKPLIDEQRSMDQIFEELPSAHSQPFGHVRPNHAAVPIDQIEDEKEDLETKA